jgi:hypothetical protein
VLQQAQGPGQYHQEPYHQEQYRQEPYGAPQPPMGGGGGGSFLGTAAAAAAGAVGGSLLLGSIRSMMGGNHRSFADAAVSGDRATTQNPWSNQSGSAMARDAGINDIGSSANRPDDHSRSGLFDSASNDDDRDNDHDDMDLDSDDFGGDGDSDYA